MQIPRRGGTSEVIVRLLYRAEMMERADLRDAMFGRGYSDSSIDNAIARLIENQCILKVGKGQSIKYMLGDEMRKYMDGCDPEDTAEPAPVVSPREARPFRELKGYSPGHRDDANRIRFISLGNSKVR
jgi:hypothetical protein